MGLCDCVILKAAPPDGPPRGCSSLPPLHVHKRGMCTYVYACLYAQHMFNQGMCALSLAAV